MGRRRGGLLERHLQRRQGREPLGRLRAARRREPPGHGLRGRGPPGARPASISTGPSWRASATSRASKRGGDGVQGVVERGTRFDPRRPRDAQERRRLRPRPPLGQRLRRRRARVGPPSAASWTSGRVRSAPSSFFPRHRPAALADRLYGTVRTRQGRLRWVSPVGPGAGRRPRRARRPHRRRRAPPALRCHPLHRPAARAAPSSRSSTAASSSFRAPIRSGRATVGSTSTIRATAGCWSPGRPSSASTSVPAASGRRTRTSQLGARSRATVTTRDGRRLGRPVGLRPRRERDHPRRSTPPAGGVDYTPPLWSDRLGRAPGACPGGGRRHPPEWRGARA